jgi:hypothetical protein
VDQEYMPISARYYVPTDMGQERDIQQRLAKGKHKKE